MGIKRAQGIILDRLAASSEGALRGHVRVSGASREDINAALAGLIAEQLIDATDCRAQPGKRDHYLSPRLTDRGRIATEWETRRKRRTGALLAFVTASLAAMAAVFIGGH